MKFKRHFELPDYLKPEMDRAKRLEWITVGYLVSVIVVMYLATGTSQAMKTAWLEDALSLMPSLAFLIATQFYNRPPSKKFPYGYHRVFSIAFLAGSLALFGMGAFLIIDSTLTLIKAEHPTIGQVSLFGTEIWLGWLMLAALAYSSIPAVILGQKKKPLAKKLHNKILLTDADGQRADYATAFAAMVGIILVGFGWWWADSVAAILIAVSVVKDGYNNLKAAILDLMDREPLTTDDKREHPLVNKINTEVKTWPWVQEAEVRLREHGQVMFGEILVVPTEPEVAIEQIEEGMKILKDMNWKVFEVVIVPVRKIERETVDPKPN